MVSLYVYNTNEDLCNIEAQNSQMKAHNKISYMSAIQIKSLSLMVLKIFARKTFLTFDIGPRSKVILPNESPL